MFAVQRKPEEARGSQRKPELIKQSRPARSAV